MTKKWNKNLFGTTVSVSNESLVTCAHMEPYNNGPIYGVNIIKPFFSKVGKCYKAEVGSPQSKSFQTFFEFDNTKESEVRTSLSNIDNGCVWQDYVWKCAEWEFNLDGYTYSWMKDWDSVSIMGTQHVQTKKGLAFNVPFARWKGFTFNKNKFYTKTMSGSIVEYSLKSDRTPIFLVATGKWHKTIDKQIYSSDPHNMDQTGASFAKGTFYSFKRHLEQFVVGSPKSQKNFTFGVFDLFQLLML